MGNGGSGSTSSHFVSDLLKTAITNDSNRFKAISLVDNVPVTLAWSNDVSYDCIFSEQLKNFLADGDIVIGFSGRGGGEFNNYCDVNLVIPSEDTPRIQEMHILIGHTICHLIEQNFINI